MLNKFWSWYGRNYKLNLYITAGLFVWQLAHLYWLSADVVGLRLFGYELWNVGKVGNFLISIVDYTEIPALILTSIFYIHELKKEFRWKSVLFLILLNSQWLHLFWITDEVVVAQFTGAAAIALPIWLSWLAILIDYLELPVIYDTIKKAIQSLRKAV
ncbi:hypothetical protein A3A03_00595 [Candidatus Nomurabacteria bacterium RIFCSPLOWO2_01_FULL_40_18]|uniref:Uncharacterized protein n=1 Tax=Candidatus Nomurabacteria bacterium RIFCSPLOWO2_01_FULL_40_18 TaxID=1801773 RepID=A0A1F6XI33_9BACT|nr:MAG: hypothetical protein A3A03_00595 [Candidatus Nomurabacteria bacterium RIFCSPLOWO2_01_FULL_40_18]